MKFFFYLYIVIILVNNNILLWINDTCIPTIPTAITSSYIAVIFMWNASYFLGSFTNCKKNDSWYTLYCLEELK